MKINYDIRPPGGWRFIDAEGFEFEAESFSGLVAKLTQWREIRGHEAGNPFEEITEQICASSPGVCGSGAIAPKPLASPAARPLSEEFQFKPDMKLVAQIVSKLAHVYAESSRGRIRPGSDDTKSRAALCAKCPAAINWKTVCPPCFSKSKKIAESALFPLKPESSLVGKACLAVGDDLSVAVHLNEGALAAGAPDFCWRSAS